MAKILLIDDDQAIVTVFETALKKEGYETAVSYTGKSGLEAVKTIKPDLVLLDQILPDMTGNDILKTLKEDPETKTIPVSILSNFGQNELVQEAINLGAEDYILKYQVEPQDLIAKVKVILEQKPAVQSTETAAPAVNVTDSVTGGSAPAPTAPTPSISTENEIKTDQVV